MPILSDRAIRVATEAINDNPEMRELDLHAHDGIWYIGHPEAGRTLAEDAPNALDGLPTPRRGAVGPLEPLLPPIPPELALWAQRLHQHHDGTAGGPQELYIRSDALVGPGPRGGPLVYDGMEAMPHPAGYAGPLHARSTSATETVATDQRQGSMEEDEDDLDDAAAHDLPGDRGPPTERQAATTRQPAGDAESGARRRLEGLPGFEVRQKPRTANSSAAETIYCILWPCKGHGKGTFESFATRGKLKEHYMTHHVGRTKARTHPGHSPLLPATALDAYMTLQCDRCHKCYASQRPMATHVANGNCTLELQAQRRTDGAEDAAERAANARAADADAAEGDELDPDNDPARPTAAMATAARANPVTANRAFLATVKPACPTLHQVHSSALPAIPAAALTTWNGLHDTIVHTITRSPGKDEGYSLLLAAPRLILSPMPGTDPRCNLPGRIKTRILRLRAGEAEALWRLYPWDKMHKVPDRIHATKTGDLTAAVNADIQRRSVVAAFNRGNAIPFAPALESLKGLFAEKVVCSENDGLEELVAAATLLLPSGTQAAMTWRDATDQMAGVTTWARTLASASNKAPDGTGMRASYYTATSELFPMLALLLRAVTTYHQGTPSVRELRASKALSAQLKKRKKDKQWPTTIEQIDAIRPLARHNALLRRIPAAAVARRGARELRQLLLAFGQYGLATAGTDALAHVAQHNYDIHHESIAALDCENAYGTLARTAILQIMMALAAAMGPESAATALLMHVLDVYAIAGPTHMWLSNGNGTSRVHTIYQTDGIDQGENNGNLIYNLVYTLIVVPRWKHFYPDPLFGATLLHDDTSLTGPASPVNCNPKALADRRNALLARAATETAAAAAAAASGDHELADTHTAAAASARARTCRGSKQAIAAAMATKETANRINNGPMSTDADKDAATAARAALAALEGNTPPLITDLIQKLTCVKDPNKAHWKPAKAATAPTLPVHTLPAAYAATQSLTGALRAMARPRPLQTNIPAGAPRALTHPELFPGDDGDDRPSPITSLPASIHVWAYLTEKLASTKIAKHKSVVVTHADSDHPFPDPPWPEGTTLPADGALVLAGCAIGRQEGRANHLAGACTKYNKQLTDIFSLEGVPRLARLLACIHATQPQLKFNHHLRGSPASDSAVLAVAAKDLTTSAICELFGITDDLRSDTDQGIADRIFLNLASGGLGLADPTHGYAVMLAAVIDATPAVSAHPALAAAFAEPADWQHSDSTILRDAHKAIAEIEAALDAPPPPRAARTTHARRGTKHSSPRSSHQTRSASTHDGSSTPAAGTRNARSAASSTARTWPSC